MVNVEGKKFYAEPNGKFLNPFRKGDTAWTMAVFHRKPIVTNMPEELRKLLIRHAENKTHFPEENDEDIYD